MKKIYRNETTWEVSYDHGTAVYWFRLGDDVAILKAIEENGQVKEWAKILTWEH